MFRTILTCACLLGGAVAAEAADFYAAIAYSSSTGNTGYAYSYRSRAAAEQAALDSCQANDARVVVWVRNGWCALALGQNSGYSTGWAATQTGAERQALAASGGHLRGVHIAEAVFSGT